MKRILLFTVSMLCLLVAKAGVITHSETFNTSGWTFHNETVDATTYTSITCDGIDLLSEPGKPQLPVKYVRLVVPYNATNISVTATCVTASTETLTNKVLPAEEPQIADETASETPIIREDSTVYNVNALFPAAHAEIVSDGYFMGENHVITVALHPASYNPVSGQFTRYNSIMATVHYDIGSSDGILLSHNAVARSKDHAMLATLVDNPTTIEAFSPSIMGPSLAQGTSNSQSSLEHYEYTVITTRELKPAYKRLIALKRQKGYTAGVVCIEDLMNNPEVNGGDSLVNNRGVLTIIPDSAGVIRQYLRRVQPLGTRYVLLGAHKVPFRYSNMGPGLTQYDLIPSDWYFSELNANWDADNDNYYGESTDWSNWKNLEIEPDLYVGRLMADTQQEVINYTDKLFRYELNPGNGNTAYLDSVLIVEGAQKFDEEHITTDAYRSINMGVRNIDQTPDHKFPTGEYVINQMKHYGIHNIHGHGSPYSVSVNNYYRDSTLKKHDTYQRIIALSEDSLYSYDYNNGLELMDNKYCPGINYSWSCTNIPYDVYRNFTHGAYLYYTGKNMGQSYTLGKDYGGVAYFGNTRDGYASYRKHEETFAQNLTSIYRAGEIESFTKQKKTASRFTLVHNLMGDPEFSIWTHAPEEIGDIALSYTDNSIVINGNVGHLMNASIGICDNNSSHIETYQNANGEIYNVSPNSIVTIYRHNAYPYISPLILQNCEISKSQYVFVPNVKIGKDVDINRSFGDVIIKENANYEIEAKGGIEISSGFTVEKGASFSVDISKDFYLR